MQELERLEQTNVYSDVFSIGIVGGHGEGKVGSINGLRLGRGSRSGTVRSLVHHLLSLSLSLQLTDEIIPFLGPD